MRFEEFTYEATPLSTRYSVNGPGFFATVLAHGWLIKEADDKRLGFLVGKPRRALIEYARRKHWKVETEKVVMA